MGTAKFTHLLEVIAEVFNLKKREVSANDKRTMHETLPTFKLKRLLCISHGLESPVSCCSKTNKIASRPQRGVTVRMICVP